MCVHEVRSEGEEEEEIKAQRSATASFTLSNVCHCNYIVCQFVPVQWSRGGQIFHRPTSSVSRSANAWHSSWRGVGNPATELNLRNQWESAVLTRGRVHTSQNMFSLHGLLEIDKSKFPRIDGHRKSSIKEKKRPSISFFACELLKYCPAN